MEIPQQIKINKFKKELFKLDVKRFAEGNIHNKALPHGSKLDPFTAEGQAYQRQLHMERLLPAVLKWFTKEE